MTLRYITSLLRRTETDMEPSPCLIFIREKSRIYSTGFSVLHLAHFSVNFHYGLWKYRTPLSGLQWYPGYSDSFRQTITNASDRLRLQWNFLSQFSLIMRVKFSRPFVVSFICISVRTALQHLQRIRGKVASRAFLLSGPAEGGIFGLSVTRLQWHFSIVPRVSL